MGVLTKLAEIVKKTFPEKFLTDLERKLISTKVALSAEEYVATSIMITIIVCIAVGIVGIFVALPVPSIFLVPVAAVIAFPTLVLILPGQLAQARASELEKYLPDALRQMASTLRAGVSIDGALEDIAKSKYGELSKEFQRVLNEVSKGRTLESALLALARRSQSPLYDRAFRLIVEGIERGAALASVLEAVANDTKETHAIQRERKTLTTQQVMFLFAVALFACPFIIGLTVGVGGISMGRGPATAAKLPPEMSMIAMGYVMIQSFVCGLAVGIIRFGKMAKGIKYSIIFLIVSAVVFTLAQIIIAGMAPKV
ncbi:MAG: type II secretion system F family protein [Candidatus Hadarchaeales archaeon]